VALCAGVEQLNEMISQLQRSQSSLKSAAPAGVALATKIERIKALRLELIELMQMDTVDEIAINGAVDALSSASSYQTLAHPGTRVFCSLMTFINQRSFRPHHRYAAAHYPYCLMIAFSRLWRIWYEVVVGSLA
jgi:hypothetical protein